MPWALNIAKSKGVAPPAAAKTAAQRQASRKARLQAAGLVRFSRWVHADDVQALREYAARLQQAKKAIK